MAFFQSFQQLFDRMLFSMNASFHCSTTLSVVVSISAARTCGQENINNRKLSVVRHLQLSQAINEYV